MSDVVNFVVSPKLPTEGSVEGQGFSTFIEALSVYLTTPGEVHLLELDKTRPEGWSVIEVQPAQGWDDVLDQMNELRHLPSPPFPVMERPSVWR